MASSKLGFKDTNNDCLLLVEGINDCHIISALCEKHKVPQTFDIFDSGCDDKAIKKLSALISAAERKKILGLVLDADDNFEGRWQSLKDKFQRQNIKLPDMPDKNGTIVPASGSHPKLGFWLMPDNQNHGMIEDFCCEFAKGKTLDFAKECVQQAEKKGVSGHKKVHRPKAEMHTYLAWQDEPGMPMGLAIKKNILDAKHPLAQDFSKWLKELFKV